MRSFLLGLVFVFFALPVIGRLIFFLLLAALPLLFTGITGMSPDKEKKEEKDDIIDVKYKIIN